MLTFRTRGTSKNFLPFNCYETPQDRKDGTDTTEYAESSDASLGRLWTSGKILADACASVAKDEGERMSSAFVARDIMQLSEALGDEDVNYFGTRKPLGDSASTAVLIMLLGMSYGTALGETLAAMFPDRINRMLLDGVLNPTEYYQEA